MPIEGQDCQDNKDQIFEMERAIEDEEKGAGYADVPGVADLVCVVGLVRDQSLQSTVFEFHLLLVELLINLANTRLVVLLIGLRQHVVLGHGLNDKAGVYHLTHILLPFFKTRSALVFELGRHPLACIHQRWRRH